MNFIGGLIINIVLLIIGFFIKRGKCIEVIAGIDKYDNKIDKIKVSNVVGKGLIIISMLNISVTIIYLISNDMFNFFSINILKIIQTTITLVGAIAIIYFANKKN